MSKVIKKNTNRDFGSYVETDDGKCYFVDSAWTRDAGYELMVFPANENFEVTDWGELYVEHYSTYPKMVDRHKIVCENLEEYLSGDAEYDEWDVDDEDEDEDEDERDSVEEEFEKLLKKLDEVIKNLEKEIGENLEKEKEVAGKP